MHQLLHGHPSLVHITYTRLNKTKCHLHESPLGKSPCFEKRCKFLHPCRYDAMEIVSVKRNFAGWNADTFVKLSWWNAKHFVHCPLPLSGAPWVGSECQVASFQPREGWCWLHAQEAAHQFISSFSDGFLRADRKIKNHRELVRAVQQTIVMGRHHSLSTRRVQRSGWQRRQPPEWHGLGP